MRNKNQGAAEFKIILSAWMLVGTLDILSAFTDYYIATGRNPVPVLKYIASGVFGKKAFTDGTSMALLGLLFHYLIAFLFTVFFFLIYSKIELLSQNKIAAGIGYGLFIWCVMNLIVVPLSNTPPVYRNTGKVMKAMLILIIMIGIPLSFIAHRLITKNRVTDK